MHVSPVKKILESKKTSVLLIVLLTFGITVFHVRHHFEKQHALGNDFHLEDTPEKEQQDEPITEVLEKGIAVLDNFYQICNYYTTAYYLSFHAFCTFLFSVILLVTSTASLKRLKLSIYKVSLHSKQNNVQSKRCRKMQCKSDLGVL